MITSIEPPAISPYRELLSTEEFLQREKDRLTDQVYQRSMELARTEIQQLDPIRRSVVSLKLHIMLQDITKLYRDGLLDGEVLIARGSHILLNLRSNDISESIRGDPQFMIGSVSKQFFAVALLKALYATATGETEAEKAANVKKLLHLPLSLFLPEEIFLGGHMPDWANNISLHHLLSHTSGLPNYTECEELRATDHSGRFLCEKNTSFQQILEIVSKHPFNFTRGTKYSYCNTGYRIIAEVISALTHMPASRFMREALFKPLELFSTSNTERGNSIQLRENPSSSRLVPQWCYDPTQDSVLKPPSHIEDASVALGAGSIISTTQDLLRWNIALHQQLSVLPRRLYELFIRENLNHYAYGISRGLFYGGTELVHTGKIGNYTTLLSYIPIHELSIIKLSSIDVESPRIEKEWQELMTELKDSIPNESDRCQEAGNRLVERYPDKRGNLRRDEILRSFMEE